jgi:predicted enzyme related to lactoylglutathione lyase
MLGERNASAVVAVKDMEAAKKFYEDVLGLKKTDVSDPSGTMYKSGDSMVFVYPSEFAGTNKATALAWGVGEDLDKIVADLKGKGVAFEHYEMPGMKVEGDVHVMGEMRAAWFKDPDGNILNLVNQM